MSFHLVVLFLIRLVFDWLLWGVLHMGYLGELVMCWNPKVLANSWISPELNCGPLSDINSSGMPWAAKIDLSLSTVLVDVRESNLLTSMYRL